MEPELATPILLISEGIEAENLSALLDQRFTVMADRRIDGSQGLFVLLLGIKVGEQ
jgi:hypothetical protein